MEKRVGRPWLAALAGLLIFLAAAWCAQRVLVPKYLGSVIEGNFTEEYYRDETSHDLLILGNCESYESISPMTLWEEYGITSYIRGNPNQLISQSYYMLMDALERETPKVVLINIQAMMTESQDTEEYNRMTFDGMAWGRNKWEAIREDAMEGEKMAEYLFPILRYHSRWSSLRLEDFLYAFREKPLTSFQGYYLRADVRPAGEFPAERRREDYSFPEKNFAYLERIREACEERGISLVLMKAPSLYPQWVPPYEEQIAEYADTHGLMYCNFLNLTEEIGLDMSQDTYDEGLHLNVYVAEKLSVYLGQLLKEAYGLADHRGEAETAAYYGERLAAYEAEKASQAEEFARLGYISKFTEDFQ